VNLSALVHGVLEELSARDPERRVDRSVAEDVRVTGDAHLLRLAIANLLENATSRTSSSA
jgi:signal transduction histidine kinase